MSALLIRPIVLARAPVLSQTRFRLAPTVRSFRLSAMASPNVPTLKLNDGHELPVLAYGLGTANYKGTRKEFDQKIVDSTVTAIKLGYTHLDGAEVYGNEDELGAAIKAGGVAREKLYVVTKYDPKPTGSVEDAFALSLQKLGVDYVDLYLIHSPYWKGVTPQQLQSRWAELEAIQASGRARSIGLSNFLQEHVEHVLATAKVVPAIDQIEFHPYLQHGDLVPYLHKHGIAVSAYAPLTAIMRASPGPLDPTYAQLAAKYGVSDSAVALRWAIDRGIVAITTSSSEKRLQSYLTDLASFQLTVAEVDAISNIGHEKHFRAFWTAQFAPEDRS
ncbi:aldo-keto reductase family 1 member c13 [Grosmannia clavigera kw1407]|uniref:Aldo-keto reductase family 1 member c13 n=1 Tax=Grosmannia clavigera (strain kw1407 / UAMH 11150) TaxID=655863 RepID=F0XTH5_GROCL|nr:aldo-keto reductase family 1 member c13 [Grosmannia clavigera kw1407]EFW98412.1 aldo-keto reductase family 1 member c13 [Grosmannia clavigera kw1407]